MYYITSDLHFSHKRIIEYFPQWRPYSSVADMDLQFISMLNNLKSDKSFEGLYHVGDFYLGKKNNLEELLDLIAIPMIQTILKRLYSFLNILDLMAMTI